MHYDDFEIVKQKGLEFYKNINEVFCPYLQEKVIFNNLGLEHLFYKQREKPRLDQDQYMRFKLINYAPEILKLSRTLQGILKVQRFEKVRSHNRTDYKMLQVTYYEFIALIKRNRIKVIVKQIGDNQKFFWSIIPFWGMNNETKSRIFHEGVPEED